MKRALVLVLLLLTAACSGSPVPGTSPVVTLPPENPAPGDHATAFVDGGGAVREYLVHAPASYTVDKQHPLVLVFHGRPGTPERMAELTRMSDVADADGFVVVYPHNMFDTDGVADLLDHLVPTWNIDPQRIYATGFSRGATLVYELAEAMSDRFAALAPVSGSRSGTVSLSRPLSLITFQGGRDSLRGTWGTINAAWDAAAGCGDETLTTISMQSSPTHVSTKTCADGVEHVVYSITGMGHSWPTDGSELIWEFFAKHSLASVTS